ncbi:MAG: sulfite reductase [Brevundimonas subvibrioides]|uniref:Sulfite reductase n=1 Tax=Brevundimonas subvibrioides TaxID=74313 RepID=A0A258HI16_9CAUL|nr:nitrite/sulfite reductase [Brevundimonas subvibrioides]OYX56630.1 MAG: sulfite reductase [Brevundimonas subvibrioides]
MYRYDEFDTAVVRERIEEFRDQVSRRVSGGLTEDEFKPLRLMNGVYLQLHAYMLRVAVPYGTMNSGQMRRLARIARVYDKGYGHFTTRTNIQYNWPALSDVPAILSELAEVEMHAIQTSGNCIRNVTTDVFAGCADDEIEDPRPWCEILRQWSTIHPEFSFLPRKFKIAVIAAPKDRAAMRTHDVGLQLIRGEDGETAFRVFVGGGQGRIPHIAQEIAPAVPGRDLLAYLTAILRAWNLLGRRDNIHKARIKILVASLGIDAFREEVERHFATLRREDLRVPDEEVARIRAYFAPPPFADLPRTSGAFDRASLADPDFARFARNNVRRHRQPGYATLIISLKPQGGVPGDITADQMDLVADLAERFSFDEVRAAYEQNLVLPHVRLDDTPEIWRRLAEAGLATPNADLVTDIIACPGLDYCSLANARSIPVAQALSEQLADLDYQERLGPIRVNMSGCINACGHHHVGHIGVLGVDRKGEEYYQITVGGSADEQAALGEIVGRSLAADEVAPAVGRALDRYLEVRREGETFLQTVRRLGADPFRDAIYGAFNAVA